MYRLRRMPGRVRVQCRRFQLERRRGSLQERLVEYCAAVMSRLADRLLYINVLQHYQQGCDCFGRKQDAICPDVGLVVSRDLIAADTAAADLLIRETGRDVALEAGGREYRPMLEYGEAMGLGSTKYELIKA